MWSRLVDGRALTFRLAGVNDQNFLMRDEETGSLWQPISGNAGSGRLRGRQLDLVHSDEPRQENPSGTVVKPVAEFASKYESNDLGSEDAEGAHVVDTKQKASASRELMIGVEHGGAAPAYVLTMY